MNKAMLLEKIAAIFSISFLAACVLVWLTGCMGLVGIKEWPTKNGPIKFVTGADFSFGASGTDSLDNRKGINAAELRKGN